MLRIGLAQIGADEPGGLGPNEVQIRFGSLVKALARKREVSKQRECEHPHGCDPTFGGLHRGD
jgi:hypothetical protein